MDRHCLVQHRKNHYDIMSRIFRFSFQEDNQDIKHFFYHLKPRFLNIWGHIIRCCGGCLVHCRTFSSLPVLFPLDASSSLLPPPPDCDNHNISGCCQLSLGRQKCLRPCVKLISFCVCRLTV